MTVRPIVCAVLLAALASAACTQMRTVTLGEMALLGPDRAWVTENDTSVVLMWEPKVVRDTLTGYIGKHREKVPSARVTQVRVQRPAPTRTALLAIGLTASMTGLLIVVGGTGQNQTQTSTIAGAPGDCDKHPEQPVCSGTPD